MASPSAKKKNFLPLPDHQLSRFLFCLHKKPYAMLSFDQHELSKSEIAIESAT